MKLLVWSGTLAILLSATVAAQPQILANGVVNAASNAPVGWPNSSVAQGSIFTIYGSNLGPFSSPALAYPLPTTLGGVAIQVSSGNTLLNAIPIFVGPNQVNAILPGSTPVGAATLTVAYNGQISGTAAFQVTANSFGIFSADSSGFGAGIVTDANYNLYSVNAPAHPGDIATMWGTGIGASPGDDGSAPPQQTDMPNLPLFVYVGTQPVSVLYRGRAAFTGEDQINFVVPPGITGCYVPVAVQIGNVVSNFVTMPIAPAGQSCPDPAPPIPTLAQPISVFTGNITLGRNATIGTTISITDYGMAFFGTPQIDAFPYAPPIYGNPYSLPVGTCTGGVAYPGGFDVLTSELNAGPLTITGPNGSQQITTPPYLGTYSAQIGGGTGANAQPLFLSAGAYTISAPGAPEGTLIGKLGPFSQNFIIPQPLTWTNQDGISTVDRSASLDVTWAGGDPDGTVQITSYLLRTFICNARTSDYHFTIPSFVLLSMPPSSTPLSDTLRLSALSPSTPFSASGISAGVINSVVTIVKNVTYQ